MKIIFHDGPLILILEGGIEARRSVPCEVPEELGLALIESGTFERVALSNISASPTEG